MIFRQSAVTHLDRDTVFEGCHQMPRDIHPALIGGGQLAMGMDATGMQGLNSQLGQYRDCAAFEHQEFLVEKSLHVYRAQVLSQHYQAQPAPRNFANMPCGWLDYALTIDGMMLDHDALLAEARQWRREFTPGTGILVTSFVIRDIEITWRVGMAIGTAEADFAFSASAQDGKSHQVGLQVRCNFTLRDGRPVFSGGVSALCEGPTFVACQWHGTDQTATRNIKTPVQLSWAWACSDKAQGGFDLQGIWLNWQGQGQTLKAGFRFICGGDRDGTHGAAFVREHAEAMRQYSPELPAIAASWNAFFATSADFGIGCPEKEFLNRMNQYLLRAGLPWDSGLPLGTMWTRKFGSATFWDSFFASDGMLRAGHIEMVRQFCDFLLRTATPTGRPHMWITYYDGDTPCNPEGDVAYFNCLAFAGVGIRLYEMTGDRDDLVKRVFPYLGLICRHLVRNVFGKTAEGGWELTGLLAGDIETLKVEARTQYDVLAWSVMTVAKFAEYAKLLGQEDAEIATCREIAAYFREHRIKLNKGSNWYQWLPYLAPAHPFVDFSSWWDGSEDLAKLMLILPCDTEVQRSIFGPNPTIPIQPMIGTYCGMAWGNLSVATAMTEVGQHDLALEFQDGSLKFISGLGYMSETPYEFMGGGNTPYVPSSGSYLSSILSMFAAGRLWDDEVRVGMDMPRSWRFQRIWWKNVRTFNGASTSATWDPYHMQCVVETNRPRTLRMRIPSRIAGEPIRVALNGKLVEPKIEGEAVVLPLPAGRNELKIERDLEKRTDILLIESFDQGRRFAEVLGTGGKSVRWLRDFDGLKAVIDRADTFVLHVSFVAPPVDLVERLAKAVREEGKTLITLFHAPLEVYSGAVAELTGLTGRPTDFWCFDCKRRQLQVLPAAKKILPGLPDRLSLYTCAKDFDLKPGSDVEVLATAADTGMPAITRRRLGKGWVWWIATGNKIMDRPGGQGVWWQPREVFVYGTTREDGLKLKWLDEPDFARVLNAITGSVR